MSLVREAIHQITEHPVELIVSETELESELGIDSIKKIMLMQNLLDMISKEKKEQLISEYGVEKLVAMRTVGELEDVLGENESSGNELKMLLAEITGYQEEIDEYAELDELGIDSIKKMQLINRMLEFVNIDELDNKDYDIEQIMRMNTVKEYEDVYKSLHGKKITSENEQLNNSVVEHEDKNTLPMNYSQYLFFLSYWSTGTLSLSSRIRLKGIFDYDSAVTAWNALIKGQPSLRTYFSCENFSDDKEAKTLEDVVLRVENENLDLPVEVYDIQELSSINQEKIIHEFCERILNSAFDIYTFPLCRLYAFRLSENETEVVLASCHLVSDGLGNQQILRDFVSLYDKSLKKEKFNYGITINEYEDVIAKSLRWKPEKQSFVKDKTERFIFPIEKKNTNTEAFGRIGSQIFHISKGDMNMMYRVANEENINMYSIIVSSYLLALHEVYKDVNRITINLPTGGRTGKEFEFKDIIGCFAQNMTITFEVNDESKNDPFLFAKKVKDIIDERFVNGEDMNESYNFVNQMKTQKIIENRKLNSVVAQMGVNSLASNLYLSFVGDTHIKKSYEMFEVIDYKAYTGMNKNSIDALVEIDDGKLMFSLNYDKDGFSDEFIRNLFDHMRHFFSRMRSIFITKENDESSKNNITIPNEVTVNMTAVSELKDDIERILGITVDSDAGLEEKYGISSIEKMKILTEVIAKYNVTSKINLFQAKTVEEMARYIESKDEKHSLAPAQRWLTSYFKEPYQWSGYSRFRFKAKLDSRIFEKALKQIISDTEALRMKFKKSNEGIKYEITDEVIYDIEYYTVGAKDKSVIDNFVKSLLEKETKQFDIEKLPLLKVRVLVYAEDDFEFLVIGHHMILDMISNDILFRRLWNNYWALLAEETSYEDDYSIIKEEKSFGSFIEAVNKEFEMNKKEYVKYWKDEISGNITKLSFINRKKSNLEEDAHVKKYICSEWDTKSWQRAAAKLKVSFYSIIALPMYQTISDLTRQNNVLLSHRMHGRIVGKEIYMNTVGNFAVNYPIGLSMKNEYTDNLTQKLDYKMRKVPLNGISYDLCGEEFIKKYYPDNNVTDIRLNFLGNREEKEMPFIEMLSENDGQRFHLKNQQRISEIEVFFYIENGCLNIEIEYSAKRCSEEFIDELFDLYLEYARKIFEERKEIG